MAIIGLHAKGRIYFVIEKKARKNSNNKMYAVFVLNFLTSFKFQFLQLFGQHIN